MENRRREQSGKDRGIVGEKARREEQATVLPRPAESLQNGAGSSRKT